MEEDARNKHNLPSILEIDLLSEEYDDEQSADSWAQDGCKAESETTAKTQNVDQSSQSIHEEDKQREDINELSSSFELNIDDEPVYSELYYAKHRFGKSPIIKKDKVNGLIKAKICKVKRQTAQIISGSEKKRKMMDEKKNSYYDWKETISNSNKAKKRPKRIHSEIREILTQKKAPHKSENHMDITSHLSVCEKESWYHEKLDKNILLQDEKSEKMSMGEQKNICRKYQKL